MKIFMGVQIDLTSSSFANNASLLIAIRAFIVCVHRSVAFTNSRLIFWLFQARNRISVNGRNASGDSPEATN